MMQRQKKTLGPARRRRYVTRFLRLGDVPALLDLERKQWTDEQSATAQDFQTRIQANPLLCGGAFCAETGELMASLFCKPTSAEQWVRPSDWAKSAALDLACGEKNRRTGALFGISLTSVDPDAAMQLIAFAYLYSVKRGDREVYLGSPMPGLRRHLERNPGASPLAYARSTRGGLPLDPQLRYYHGKGFNELVAVVPDYFPHEASCDYGAVIKTRVPHSWLHPLMRHVPTSLLRWLAAMAPRLYIPQREGREDHTRGGFATESA